MIALRFQSLALVVLWFGAAYSSPVPAPTPTQKPTHEMISELEAVSI